jgi:protein phosphatase 2C
MTTSSSIRSTHYVVQDQGKRMYMEDRYLAIPRFHNGYSLFAVFDGHGGAEVAEFCKQRLPWILRGFMDQYGIFDMRIILEKTFQTLHESIPAGLCYSCGTTALVVLQHTNHIWVANCGDSRAVMNFTTFTKELTHDHKPGTATEKRRIEALGGRVVDVQGVMRVNGELAVSRSIGDNRYHPFVIPHPDVYYYPLNNGNKFIILASDGLWDVMASHDVVSFVSAKMSFGIAHNVHTYQNCVNAINDLKKYAYQTRNAEDNMTIIGICLDW